MGVLVQVVATVFLCFSYLNASTSIAWPSSTMLLFKSENTTLHRPMSELEIALLSSLPLFGTMIAQPLLILCVLDKFGLKRTATLTALLFTIGWALIAVTNQVEVVLIAVLIIGLGYGTFIIVPMYISEIAQDSIRGVLTACPSLAYSLGFLVSYLLGGILEYHKMVYCNLSLAVVGVLMITILKESPVRFLIKGKEEEAAKALAFYRQTSSTSKEVMAEINNIRRSLNTDNEDAESLTCELEQVKPAVDAKGMSCWQLFKTTPAIRHQFYLVMALETTSQFMGMPSVQVYAEPIFTATVGNVISPNLCSVIFGFLMLVTGVVAAYLVDVVGRRPLQLSSCLVCSICFLFLGTQIIMEWFPNWTIMLFIYVFGISYILGTGTVAFVVSAELYLPQVKSKLLMVSTQWGCICSFVCMFFFGLLIQTFGYASAFYLFSAACFASFVYYYYCLPETKGLPVYAIQDLFAKKVIK